jgi:hypothetical protein
MGNYIFKKDPDENSIQHTAKMIAYSLILIFFIGLLGTGAVSAVNNNNEWFNLFKDGFLILAGAITTIIGYYFGSKRTEIIESDLRRVKKEKMKAIKQRKAKEAALEDALGGSDDMNASEPPQEELLQPGVPGIIDPYEMKED